MGSQRRLQEVSKLVEKLDQHNGRKAKSDPSYGELRGIRVGVEESNTTEGTTVAYIQARWLPGGAGSPHAGQPLRFYEAYWAPIAADGVPRLQVVKWMFAQVPKPLGAMFTPWRHRGRLRRAALQALDLPRPGPGQPDISLDLARAYAAYDRDSAREAAPDGHFGGFLRLLDAMYPEAGTAAAADVPPRQHREAAYREALRKAAKRWRRASLKDEWGNLAVLTTLAVVVLAVVGLSALTALWAALALRGQSASDLELAFLWDNRELLLTGAGLLFLVPGLTGFLQSYLGDVMLWATYEETNIRYRKRKEIMDVVRTALRHVLEDPWVERVVVVAHSLGTSVAVDAILREGRELRALRGQAYRDRLRSLRKITHVVTYGSPIDKIHYLFEEAGEQGHRYNRVVEDLRGDLGSEPFGNNNGQRWIHWVNFWDRADIIASSLESPCNADFPHLRVDNVQVAGDVLPSPGAAHTRYLDRPEVLDGLTEIITRRTTGRQAPLASPPLESPDLGPGSGHWWVRPAQVMAALTAWAVVGVLGWFVAEGWLDAVAYTTVGMVGFAILLLLSSRLRAIVGCLGLLWEAIEAPFRRG
jgi:hypothetical protein